MDEPPENLNQPQFWQRINTNTLVRFLLFFASGWALIQLFGYFEYVIFVFTFAAILALLLNYPVRYLEQFLGRSAALGIVIVLSLLTVIGLVITVGFTIAGQLQQLVDVVTQVLSSPENPLSRLENLLAARNIRLNLAPLEEQLRNLVTSSMGFVIGYLPSIFSNYVTFIIILVVAFFMLTDGEKLWQLLLRLIPEPHQHRVGMALQTNFLGFVRGQLLISALLSGITFVVFLLLNIPFALALAVTVGIFDLIPGIGATLGVSFVCLIILVQGGWLTALKALIACIVLQQIQDNFVAPRIMQSTVHLNPVVVFFALLVGTRVAGLLGIFLAVPLAGVAVSLLDIEELRSR